MLFYELHVISCFECCKKLKHVVVLIVSVNPCQCVECNVKCHWWL